ncbi:MAG: glycosyltransferase family 2 protein [bacterium]|nr:glycosyltransferase family 2 protein [bacterium]
MNLLSVVVPVYFEEECINQFITETTLALDNLDINWEIIFIDDGSTDSTISIIKKYTILNEKIKLIQFSYNHGKQLAVTAGIAYASGDIILTMDPDLQDPPEEIENFVNEINKGFDIVLGIRKEKKDKFFNKFFSKLFWTFLEKTTDIKIPKGISSMRIFNRKVADKFLEYKEQNRFIEGILMHIGMKRGTLLINQRERYAGKSKFSFKRKVKLAFNVIFDYSELPLKIVVKLGFYLFLFGILFMIAIILLKLTLINFQIGWPSLICSIILGSGLQIFFIGIAALYIGRIYKETKGRPLYSIIETTNFKI